MKHGKLHDDSWSGLFRQIRAGNNDKTTVAGKGILLAMCHLSPLSCMAISSAWGSRRSSEDWQQSADSVEKVALAAACRSGVPAVEVAA
ncbi:hypothetical protein P3846_27010, partial [Pseudomonas aeruginosa]|nr:hypothetical protein [Pseudomonas aeruginosa]